MAYRISVGTGRRCIKTVSFVLEDGLNTPFPFRNNSDRCIVKYGPRCQDKQPAQNLRCSWKWQVSSCEQDRQTGRSYRAELIQIWLTLCFTELRFECAHDGNEACNNNAAGACNWEAQQLQNRLYSAVPYVWNLQYFIRCFDNCICFRLQVPLTVTKHII